MKKGAPPPPPTNVTKLNETIEKQKKLNALPSFILPASIAPNASDSPAKISEPESKPLGENKYISEDIKQAAEQAAAKREKRAKELAIKEDVAKLTISPKEAPQVSIPKSEAPEGTMFGDPEMINRMLKKVPLQQARDLGSSLGFDWSSSVPLSTPPAPALEKEEAALAVEKKETFEVESSAPKPKAEKYIQEPRVSPVTLENPFTAARNDNLDKSENWDSSLKLMDK